MIISTAPTRITFAGGNTDVAPYCERHGGKVVYTAIQKATRTTLRHRADDQIVLRHQGRVTRFRVGELPPETPEWRLPRALLEASPLAAGAEIEFTSQVPPSSGLGSSSSLLVSALGAFSYARGEVLDRRRIASLALKIERVGMGVAGGQQDHFACSYGGLGRIAFGRGEPLVESLHVSPQVVQELESRGLLVHTGERRNPERIQAQYDSTMRDTPEREAILHAIKQLATQAETALVHGELDEIGRILHEGWQRKRELDAAITTPEIDDLYAHARAHGAMGGRLLGSGGGGYMLLLAKAGMESELHLTLSRRGLHPEPLRLSTGGVDVHSGDPSVSSPAMAA